VAVIGRNELFLMEFGVDVAIEFVSFMRVLQTYLIDKVEI